MRRLLLALALLAVASAPALAQSKTNTLFQRPAVSRTSVAFSYAGDLWIVGRDGGSARRLTTGIGIETDPVFSPDGGTIAFTGQYDGNTDVYVVAAGGGVPRRLTYHPAADEVVAWSPDGKRVLFRSSRKSVAGYNQLFTMPLTGGLPDEVPLPMADSGAFSPDGAFIAYQPLSQWTPDWKRYHGGQTGRITIARLSDSSIELVPRENSNDTNPMWVGNTVYFLSDRAGATTLFAYDTATKKVSQVVHNDGLDIKSADACSDAIVYERFGTLFLYDLKSGNSRQLDIRVEGDLPGVRPRYEKVGSRISAATISPTGMRAAFEARGEIITVPADKGDPRILTNTPGVMERDPSWSPDGKWIACFSDESGEYALQLRDQKGEGAPRMISLGSPASFYYTPVWSPDSTKIAYTDRRFTAWYVDIVKGTPVKIDSNPVGFGDGVLSLDWSPDGRWITYSKQLPNFLRAVFVYSLETGQTRQVTDGLSDARSPVFDHSGKYIFFTASTDVGPSLSWADLSGIDHQVTRSVYAIVLRNDLPSPLAPESDEETVKSDEKKDAAATPRPEGPQPADAAKTENKAPEPVKIDFERIDQRVVALPIPARSYQGLVAGKAGTLFLLEAPPSSVSDDGPGPSGLTVQKFDLEKRKLDKALDNVSFFAVSANGEKMLYQQGPQWTIAGTAGPPEPGKGALRVDAMETYVDPRAEWRQMYHEVWRSERDFFYDPNHHGLDLAAAERFYAPYVASIAHRADLNYLFREMLNQLTVGHMFVGGGDAPRPGAVPGGLLGCDFEVTNDRYRFARVFNGENWNPKLTAPLTQPGVNVVAGEYLLAVNGRDLRASANVYQAFENTAGKQVVIKVGPNADGTGSRNVTVVPVPSETGLRHLAWIEDNRRKVSQLSGGRLAYVYVPNTGNGGFTSFNRYFFAQTDKDGAVIDERFNGGGLLADYIVNYLTRPQLAQIHFRYGTQDIKVPGGAIYGPKVMLINELAGSGGDALPWFFGKMKVGTLVGKRTWGGLIASFPAPQLMDGGFVTSPDAAVYGLNGEWEVENVGVPPDVEIDMDPAAWRLGHDTQLEKAVGILLDDLKRNPRPAVKVPPYPTYKRGLGLDGKP